VLFRDIVQKMIKSLGGQLGPKKGEKKEHNVVGNEGWKKTRSSFNPRGLKSAGTPEKRRKTGHQGGKRRGQVMTLNKAWQRNRSRVPTLVDDGRQKKKKKKKKKKKIGGKKFTTRSLGKTQGPYAVYAM